MGANLDFCKKVKCKLIPVCSKYNFCNPEKRCSNTELYKIEKYKFDRKLEYTTDYYFNRLDAIKKVKGEG